MIAEGAAPPSASSLGAIISLLLAGVGPSSDVMGLTRLVKGCSAPASPNHNEATHPTPGTPLTASFSEPIDCRGRCALAAIDAECHSGKELLNEKEGDDEKQTSDDFPAGHDFDDRVR